MQGMLLQNIQNTALLQQNMPSDKPRKSKKIGEIIADREMLLAQLKKQEAVTRYEEQLAQAESMEK